mmetsp:Transcript_18402/g.51585  ORF Transcript_18402/g.51585 Transcript_18402/m.51585 type:complete len:215 (-) Transcript_18402:2051-2695(-)
MVKHQDCVSVHDCGQAVCNDDSGDAGADGAQRGLNLLLCDGVQCARGLIKDQDGGLLHHCACKSHALLFTPTEAHPTLSYTSVVALLEGVHNCAVDVGNGCSLGHLLVSGVWCTIAYVVGHGLVEQDSILGHDADGLPHRSQGGILDVLVVNVDRARKGIIKAQQELENGTLAATSGAHHSQGSTTLDAERYASQDWNCSWVVPKDDIPEVHST